MPARLPLAIGCKAFELLCGGVCVVAGSSALAVAGDTPSMITLDTQTVLTTIGMITAGVWVSVRVVAQFSKERATLQSEIHDLKEHCTVINDRLHDLDIRIDDLSDDDTNT